MKSGNLSLEGISKVFDAIGNPRRLEMFLYVVNEGPTSIDELFENSALDIEGSTKTFHLNRLRGTGLILAERIDGYRLRLTANPSRISEAMNSLETIMKGEKENERDSPIGYENVQELS